MAEAVKETEPKRFFAGKPGPGRPKGSVNKVGKAAREVIAEAAERLGGVERDIRELTYGVQPGSEQALEVRAVLMRQLEQIRLSIPRRDAIRLEGLIDSTTKGAT